MPEPQNQQERLRLAGIDSEDVAEQGGLSEALAQPVVQSANITLDGLGQALSGPMADVKGAIKSLDRLGDVVKNPGAALGNAIGGEFGNIVSGLLSGSGIAFGGGIQKNPLSRFASYNNIFTLGVLSTAEVNNPDLTYRKRGPSIVILKSGGTGGNQVKTPLEKAAGITGEYFIDDVEIGCLIAPNPKTKQTNATNISFRVMEPYSMGQFLKAMHSAAIQGGYKNYLDAPYLLQIEFIGWDDNGRPVNDSRSRRMFPLKFSNVTFDVDENGSNYEVTAIPWHEQALTDERQQTPNDTDIKGTTLLELLQTGPESLSTILNTREQEQVQAGNKKVADEYVIMFPKELASATSPGAEQTESNQGATTSSTPANGSASGNASSEERNQELFDQLTGTTGGDVPEDFDAEVSKILGIVVRRSQLGESIRESAEKEENVNAIGKSKIVKSFLDEGTQFFGKPAFVENEENPGNLSRALIQTSDEGRRINFKQGTRVQDIIEEAILISEYGRQFPTQSPDSNGMKQWFRIESDVFAIPGNDNVAQTGTQAKIYVYKVVPFQVQTSRLTSPTQSPAGFAGLRNQAVKKYDYIYTGENDDIINFDININTAFFNALNGDFGQLTQSQKTQGSGGTVASPDAPVHGAADGDESNSSSAGVSGAQSVPSTNTGESGSGPQNHPETQVARSFNDSIVNSNTDLVSVELEIWGDPYYIADSGMGNYSAGNDLGKINLTTDGTMNYQNGEVDIELNFRTPIDIRDHGSMKFPAGATKAIGAFSGLYQVTQVTNSWSGNQFKQTLKTIRRRNQPEDTGVVPLDIAIEAVIEKGIDAIISPLASAPVAAFNGALQDIQGEIDAAAATLSTGLGGALANGAVALDAGINEVTGNLAAALKENIPTIPSLDVEGSLSSALSETPVNVTNTTTDAQGEIDDFAEGL